MSNEKETVTISKKLYDTLQEDSEILDALRAGGVDNWDGYDFALEDWRNQNED
jgi:hypothetical protein